jgi:hypothetical protein
MLDKADKQDKEYEENRKKLAEEKAKISGFTKVWPYSQPKLYVFVAITASILKGGGTPV